MKKISKKLNLKKKTVSTLTKDQQLQVRGGDKQPVDRWSLGEECIFFADNS